MSLNKTAAIAIGVIVLTFVAGMAAGVFGAHMLILRGGRGAEHFPERAMVNRLDRRLDLTDAQRAQVEQIIRRRHARINELRHSVRPQVRAELERANNEIAQILTPEQRERFAKMRLRMHKHGPPRHGKPPRH